MTAQFLTDLIVRDDDGRHMTLHAPLKFYSAQRKGSFIAPEGFQTDFASIPRGFWNLIPKNGKWDKAAVMHDAAYRGELQTPTGRKVHLIKAYADDLFYEAMRASGVNAVTATLMYKAVSWFGGSAYKAGQRVEKATEIHR